MTDEEKKPGPHEVGPLYWVVFGALGGCLLGGAIEHHVSVLPSHLAGTFYGGTAVLVVSVLVSAIVGVRVGRLNTMHALRSCAEDRYRFGVLEERRCTSVFLSNAVSQVVEADRKGIAPPARVLLPIMAAHIAAGKHRGE